MKESLIPSPGEICWKSAALTHKGCKRQHNEDSMLERPDLKLWGVADGMGGYEAGDVASRMVVEALMDLPLTDRLSLRVDAIESRMLGVHEQLHALGADRGTISGSTLMLLQGHDRHALLMWAGDSRAYLYRNDSLVQVSQDHSYVNDLFCRGEISKADMENHPQANLITRAVGASGSLYIDMDILDVQVGDTFLLCSDGLDKELSLKDMTEIMSRGATEDVLAETLLETALERGARDNVTVLVVRCSIHD